MIHNDKAAEELGQGLEAANPDTRKQRISCVAGKLSHLLLSAATAAPLPRSQVAAILVEELLVHLAKHGMKVRASDIQAAIAQLEAEDREALGELKSSTINEALSKARRKRGPRKRRTPASAPTQPNTKRQATRRAKPVAPTSEPVAGSPELPGMLDLGLV